MISVYGSCEIDTDFSHQYLGKDYGNSWRMSGDIANTWASLATIAANAANIAQYAAPGGFNDLDMLQLGNGALNENEERAHMGLWAIAKSPLLIGTDLSKVKTSTLNLFKNKVSPHVPSLLSYLTDARNYRRYLLLTKTLSVRQRATSAQLVVPRL